MSVAASFRYTFGAAAAQHCEKVCPKNQQGIFRCRAGAGGQGKPRGDGKPAGPDLPLEKGVGGIKTNARSVGVWGGSGTT